MAFKKLVLDDENEGSQNSEFEQMLNDSFKGTSKKLSVGQKIRAEILSVGKDQTIVTTGTIHDGFVPTAHLLDEQGKPKFKTGDHVDLFVTFVRGAEIILSPNPTAKNLAEDIQDAFDKGLSVEGRVGSVNKGGFEVVIMGKTAFCPISQMDTKHIEKGDDYVGKKFEFKITQFSEGGKKITVSRRRLLEENRGLEKVKFLQSHKVGDVLSGVVTKLEAFGAFVEIAPGIEALAHISEISWHRIKHPKDSLEIGQPVSAKIIRIEEDAGRLRISVSLKNSDLEPWQNLPSDIQAGKIVAGTISRCMPFGAFVALSPGIEGLIPLSEMSYTKRATKGDDFVKEGEKVMVMVKDIDVQSKRISLSLKEAGEKPGAAEEADYKEYQAKNKSTASSQSFGSLADKMAAALKRQG